MDLKETFGLMYGLRLRRGTRDKLEFAVNDALAGLITFNIIAYGIQTGGDID